VARRMDPIPQRSGSVDPPRVRIALTIKTSRQGQTWPPRPASSSASAGLLMRSAPVQHRGALIWCSPPSHPHRIGVDFSYSSRVSLKLAENCATKRARTTWPLGGESFALLLHFQKQVESTRRQLTQGLSQILNQANTRPRERPPKAGLTSTGAFVGLGIACGRSAIDSNACALLSGSMKV